MNRNELRSFYSRMQSAPERARLIEELLDDPNLTDQVRVQRLHASGLFEDESLNPAKLSRYADARLRAENRATLKALIDEEVDAGLNAVGRNPSGSTAKYLRAVLSDAMLKRAMEGIGGLDFETLSMETARQAKVEQDDRKLSLDERKLEITNEALNLQIRKFEEQLARIREKAEQLNEVKAGDTLSETQIADIRAIFGMTGTDGH